jgi:CHAT domain-containing protein
MRGQRELSNGLIDEGDFPQGDDRIALSRAFVHAGALSVVASLWKLLDDLTFELMKGFRRSSKDPSKADGRLR